MTAKLTIAFTQLESNVERARARRIREFPLKCETRLSPRLSAVAEFNFAHF